MLIVFFLVIFGVIFSWVLSASYPVCFLPARRYASAGNRDRNVSACPSVCLSVRHAPVLCQIVSLFLHHLVAP